MKVNYNKRNNVFTYCYYYKWWNIFKNITNFFRTLKFAWQRARYGFSSYDIWDFDDWFTRTIPAALRALKDNGCGYPMLEGFDQMTDEQCVEAWHNILDDIIESIEFSQKEFYDEYPEFLKTPLKYCEAWREVQDKFTMEQRKKLKHGMDLLYQYMPNLWD